MTELAWRRGLIECRKADTFYSVTALGDPPASLRALVGYLRPGCIPIISRAQEEDHGWDNFRADRDDPDRELLPSLPGAAGLDLHYRDGVVLAATLDGSATGVRIGRAVEARIPEDIRGDYAPWDPFVQIGWHDLWECAEHDDGLFIARAFLSIGFFGYSTPNNWPAFRKAVFQLPEVQEIKVDLERVIGQPLEEVVYWNT